MTYLGKRKVSNRGTRGLSIMLPTLWCRATGVTHGSYVAVWADFDEGTIYIRSIPELPEQVDSEAFHAEE